VTSRSQTLRVLDQPDDWQMVRIALADDRIILTRDTGVMKRRVITSGKIKALLVAGDDPEAQLRQVIEAFGLEDERAFTRCMECNGLLAPVEKESVKDLVPPYVFRTQTEFVRCAVCGRVYWRGTHWQAMLKTLGKMKS
jgi:uncharacterized protein with PIN domain